MYQTTDRRNGGPRLMEPTPQFISNKQVSISESNSINLNMVMVHNNQTTISSQSMNIGDFSPNDQAINTSQVKRSPNISNHRSKPQSPKILLPQCFLDQPHQHHASNGKQDQKPIGKVLPGQRKVSMANQENRQENVMLSTPSPTNNIGY